MLGWTCILEEVACDGLILTKQSAVRGSVIYRGCSKQHTAGFNSLLFQTPSPSPPPLTRSPMSCTSGSNMGAGSRQGLMSTDRPTSDRPCGCCDMMGQSKDRGGRRGVQQREEGVYCVTGERRVWMTHGYGNVHCNVLLCQYVRYSCTHVLAPVSHAGEGGGRRGVQPTGCEV